MARLWLAVALSAAAVLAAVQTAEAVRCQIPKTATVKGGPVSWWMGYKVISAKTAQNDQEFVWLSSQHKSGSAYEVHATSAGPLATTLAQLSATTQNHDALRYIKWNDQPPASSVGNALHPGVHQVGEAGHAKGVLASSYTRAFYLTHSWPQFPDPGTGSGFSSKDSRPDAITQAFFCFSLDLVDETPEKLMTHLGLVRPGIYDSWPSDITTVDPAWAVILSYPRDQHPPTNFMAKDVVPLIADSALAAEGPLPKAAPAQKPTQPTASGQCGGGASCLSRRAQIAGKAAPGSAPKFAAGYVQLFASSVTNTPGTFWSAFRKWVFPGRPFSIQTWVSAAVKPDEKLNENLFLSGPLQSRLMSYACFPGTQGPLHDDANCRERRELHSKVAVSQSQQFPVTCFADINMEQTRSGGMLCLNSEPVRNLVSDYIYALPKPVAASSAALPSAVSIARVDKCVSATGAACTVTTQVETLAAAYTYAQAHPLAATPVTPAPTSSAKPPANDPNYVAAACAETPVPCPKFAGRDSGPVITATGPAAGTKPAAKDAKAKAKAKTPAAKKTAAKAKTAKTAAAKTKVKTKTKPSAKAAPAKTKAKAKAKAKKPTKQKALL